MPKHSTTDQLREDIDRGRTGDKIEVSDPAAAPLGTDEEAAGTPTPGEALQQARDYERGIGRMVHGSMPDDERLQGSISDAARISPAVWLYGAIILALTAAVTASAWLSYPA
jgi:hypothetical protein